MVESKEIEFSDIKTGKVGFKAHFLLALDPESGVKQRVIALSDLGINNEIIDVAQSANKIFQELDDHCYISFGNNLKPTGHSIDITQMSFSSKIFIYTNKVFPDIGCPIY